MAQALRLTLQLIKADKTNAEAYAIRGMALFLSADYDQGLKHLKESLRLDPDARSVAMLRRDLFLLASDRCALIDSRRLFAAPLVGILPCRSVVNHSRP